MYSKGRYSKKVIRQIQFTNKIREVGINGLKLEDLIDSLKRQLNKNELNIFNNGERRRYKLGDIIVLVDIRRKTWCKSNQGFNPENLEEKLRNHKIEYLRYQELGNPFYKDRSSSPNQVKESYQGYLTKKVTMINNTQYFPENAFIDLFKRINSAQPHKIHCLMCYCNEYYKCHRSWLKEALVNYKRNKLDLPENYELMKINKEEIQNVL